MIKEVKKLSPAEIIASEDALMDFQFAVIDALNSKGITKADFAEMLGVSRARVSQMLSSEANPTIKLVGRALYILGLKANYSPLETLGEYVAATGSAAGNTVDEFDAIASWKHAVEEYHDKDESADTRLPLGDACRWWAVQHNPDMDVWGGSRAVANSNNRKKLAAA